MTLLGVMQDKQLLVSDIIRYAETYHSDREVVWVDSSGELGRYSYGAAGERARKIARLLAEWGIERGDRVATIAMNHSQHFELFFGVSGFGAVLHTINPRLHEEQITYICNHAEDRILFFDAEFLPIVSRLAKNLRTIERFVVIGDLKNQPSDPRPLFEYENTLREMDARFEWPEFDERSASALCYTSGTTGNPKGVLYSHRGIVLHAMAAAQASAMGLCCHDAILPIAPMFHVNGWSLPYMAPMLGAKLVLPGRRVDPEVLCRLIEREGITFAAGVPTVFVSLLEYLERTAGRLGSLKKAVIGGTAVSPAMVDLLTNKYGCSVLQMWGMTELGPLGTMSTATAAVDSLPEPRRRSYLEKQGRVQFGLELKVVDDDGKRLPHDGRSPGSLWIKGAWAAAGYYKAEGGHVLDSDGWLPTGDVATIDDRGYLRITDRAKDVVKSGGEWISSVDLENVTYGCPGIRHAAVVGAKHPKWDERPILIVEPQAGAEISREIILEYLRPRVAKWWLPDDVVFVEEMPLTPTGKIRKQSLRERFADHLSRRVGPDPSNFADPTIE